MDTTLDTLASKTVQIIGRKPTIKLFEKHNVESENTQPPVTPRTRRHFQQMKDKKKATGHTAYGSPTRTKSNLKVGVSGMYGGDQDNSEQCSGDKRTKNTGRKYINEDNMWSGARENRALKEGQKHRLHYQESGDQLVRFSENTKVSSPKPNAGLKCYQAGGERVGPFGVDTHVPKRSNPGKRQCSSQAGVAPFGGDIHVPKRSPQGKRTTTHHSTKDMLG